MKSLGIEARLEEDIGVLGYPFRDPETGLEMLVAAVCDSDRLRVTVVARNYRSVVVERLGREAACKLLWAASTVAPITKVSVGVGVEGEFYMELWAPMLSEPSVEEGLSAFMAGLGLASWLRDQVKRVQEGYEPIPLALAVLAATQQSGGSGQPQG
ncbi:hypothetical protein Pyrfu_0388 [Pyrolobus fumarii 1A]|uniref:Uncharacterized protein n=1 Tax=Pyrolobus fumarii (strain DSM 11204 / 1A) TaxID=694429 RepID=G0EFT9_PYRF1|nr:hypothetical protein [Pyrolobus fumarii]AEM38260.1 hypothetical protein Pyrfu_0388 [Pyrolobus fumarii 1A]